MKEHRLLRRAKFVPTNGDCPVRVNQLNNYRKTIHRNGVTHEVLVDSLWELSERDQHAIASDVPWTGETWFQVKCETVALPGEARGVRAIAVHYLFPAQGRETMATLLR